MRAMHNVFNQLEKRFVYQRVSKIPKVDIIADNKPIYRKCLAVLKHFFIVGVGPRAALKGFLFEGPPGTGKTELVRQIAKGFGELTSPRGEWSEPSKEEPFLVFLDGASIASPRWGDAETILERVFSKEFREELSRQEKVDNPRVILLFDDIESLMLARSSEIAKEWHFSINAVLFHQLDSVDPSKTFVFATTNRPDLVDEALRDRLYSIEFRPPSRESLLEITQYQLRAMGDIPERHKAEILKVIEGELDHRKSATIRDIERLVIMECVERGAWE
jgi:SpoVK/Ycf46/Vps4 family AAA+-type ATPase